MGLATLPPAKLVALALVANLSGATFVALAVFPVETTTAVKDATAAWPDALRAPIHSTFDWLAEEAVRGDNERILQLAMRVTSDPPVGEWSREAVARLSWDTLGGTVDYRWVATASGEPPEDPAAFTGSVRDGSLAVALPEGQTWVHLLPTAGGGAGVTTSVGPLQSDPTPPPAPRLGPLGSEQVETYHFAITWGKVLDVSGVSGYVVYKATDGAGPYAPYKEVGLPELTERNQLPGSYWYKVAARNGAGALSDPSAALKVTVNPKAKLTAPPPGAFDHGIQAVYDSLLQVWDISDPARYDDLNDIPQDVHEQYAGPGAGIEVDDAALVQRVRGLVASEQNTLVIGMLLFEFLFNETDYDYTKFQSTATNFQGATETLETGLGICGDLTALYVTLLRIAGVPARPVHGYLINSGSGGGSVEQGSGFQPVGGFHMWAELWVGGDEPGGPWLPVDVSGVTGDKAAWDDGVSDFTKDRLDLYFGIFNPEYLQLGVQKDLGVEGGKELADRWNVWATLNWNFYDPGQGDPDVTFDADGHVTDVEEQAGYVFFTADHRRALRSTDDPSDLSREFSRYFVVKQQARKVIDYGADVATTDSRVCELHLLLKFPEEPAASQAVLFTTYSHGAVVTPEEPGLGYFEWTIPGPGAAARACD